MALAQLDVYNITLTKLGQDRASSTSEDVEQVRVLNALWAEAVDWTLADHPWKFAILRAELAADVTPPAWGWSRAFSLPEPCLRLVQVGDTWAWYYEQAFEAFQLEGGKVLTDEGAPLRVRYVQRISTVGLWPVMFADAVAMRLAYRAAIKLTNSNAREQSCAADYDVAIRKAKRQSAIERPPNNVSQSDWLDARGG
jgi:hypothetical protein